jgi:hypothetical protein
MPNDRSEQDNRRLHYELEHAIKAINTSAIGALTGPITKAAFTNVAQTVAGLRARYLQSVVALGARAGEAGLDDACALELRRLREAYMEAKDGFSALQHALERGYVMLAD